MKVRATVEFETEVLSKHQTDGFIVEMLSGAGLTNVRVVGAYTNEENEPITDDFFVVDENFAQTTECILKEAGVSEDDINKFLESDKLFDLHYEWNQYIADNADANMTGREKFMEMALKHATNRAA